MQPQMHPLFQLLQDFRVGDAKAVDTVIAQFSHIISNECRKFGVGQFPELSHSDLVQEVILRVWMHVDEFRGDGSMANMIPMFESWLRKTTRSVLANIVRDRRARKRHPDESICQLNAVPANRDPSARTPGSLFDADEQFHRLKQMMAELLDDESSRIVWLHVAEGQTFGQISRHLGLTYDQVRYRYRNALARMAARLDQLK